MGLNLPYDQDESAIKICGLPLGNLCLAFQASR